MEYDYNKIYEALETLKRTCIGKACENCPLYDSKAVRNRTGTLCSIKNGNPSLWEYKKPPTDEVFRFFGGAE